MYILCRHINHSRRLQFFQLEFCVFGIFFRYLIINIYLSPSFSIETEIALNPVALIFVQIAIDVYFQISFIQL